jgi:release factor glutamine methyltransferase
VDAPPTLIDLVQKSAQWLGTKGIANARREAEWIFAESLGLTRIELYTRFDMPLEPAEVERLRALIARRGKREPLAYVIGTQPFRTLSLRVGPGVLVPRPETEELVGHALAALPPSAHVLDVGTGSGAIALAIKAERPDAQVAATDASPAALAIAKDNASRLAIDVTFHEGHLANHLPAGTWDCLCANLPYIGDTSAERARCDIETTFEPTEALFAGPDGLALIAPLVADLPRLLSPVGQAWFEHGHEQAARIRSLAGDAGLAAETKPDLAGKDRITRMWRG